MVYETKKIKEFAKVEMGQSPKSIYYNNIGEGLPFLQGVRTFGDIYPSIDTYTTKFHKVAEKGDILFTVRAPVGDINIAPERLCIGRGLAAISVKDQSNPQMFLYYLLKNNKNIYDNYSTGTIYSSINKTELENIELLIPDNSTQLKITSLLYSLDKKIETNNKIISNLEDQAQAIFKSWFVDFEPFQDGEFVESDLGIIPKGWEVSITGDEFVIEYGKNLPTNKLTKTGYPVFGGNGVIGFYTQYLYDEPRLLVSCRGAASGKVGLSKEKSFVTNNSLVFNENNHNYFYYFNILFSKLSFESYVTGSAQPQLTITNSKNIKLLLPIDKVILNFNKIIIPMFNLQRKLENQNQTLSQTRDALLPKLMSGEIDVSGITLDEEDDYD